MEQLPSLSASSWSVHTALTKTQFEEFRAAGIAPLHAQLLFNRGITTPEAMRRFLAASFDEIPDPLTLIDMERAVERISRALDEHEHITIYGDFDADGVTSAALLIFRIPLRGSFFLLLFAAVPYLMTTLGAG